MVATRSLRSLAFAPALSLRDSAIVYWRHSAARQLLGGDGLILQCCNGHSDNTNNVLGATKERVLSFRGMIVGAETQLPVQSRISASTDQVVALIFRSVSSTVLFTLDLQHVLAGYLILPRSPQYIRFGLFRCCHT